MINPRALAMIAAILSFAILDVEAAPRPSPTPALPSKGAHFESVGRISLHVGQPCASQIMFDFRDRSLVWLAAPKQETSILTEAVRHHERVHVAGVWRRGSHPGCVFVEVTSAVPEKKILGIF